jgi:NADH-quinone oxidoreductase subunit I
MTSAGSNKKISETTRENSAQASSARNAASNPWFEVFGMGVFKGMMVTLKNFLTSYYKKPDDGGVFTVQYPEEREKEIENFRNFPFLVYDGTPEKIRCVACGICERECPPKCIHIEMETDPAGKPTRKPAVFDVDYGLCMNCGICEEVCPFDSIFMDHAFEVTASERQAGLIRSKEALSKSNEYFQKIRPALAATIDQKRKAAEEKKKAAVPPPPAQELK